MSKERFYDTVFKDSLEVIIDATKIGLWDWHLPSGRVIYSKQWESILGYDEGELPQTVQSWENAVFPEDLIIAEKAISDYLEGKTQTYEAEFRTVRKDGSVIWAQDRGTVTERDADGNPIRLVGILQDISRIRKTEEELREKTEQLDFVAKLSGLGAWDWDLTTNRITYNDEYLHMLGYTQNEISGTMEEWENFNHPGDLPKALALLDDYLAGRSDSYTCEIRMRHRDGHYIWTFDMGRIAEWDESGNPKRVLGGHLNIDKLKKAEEKLQSALNEIEQINVGLQGEIEKGIQNYRRAQGDLEKRDFLLSAVNNAASILIAAQQDDFAGSMQQALKTIGEAVQVDRAYIWENHEENGELRCTQIAEWSGGAEPQQGNDLTVSISYDECIPRWRETLARNKCINAIVKDMLPAEQAQLVPQGIVSLLLIPIFVQSKFQGFIGFDDCRNERVFSEIEESVLRSSGLLCGAALLRNQINKNLIQAKEEAQANAHAKSAFLASMSHEIRTPMNAIIGMTTIAKNADSRDKMLDSLGKIESASRHLLGIINDILDMSKIDAEKLELNPEDTVFAGIVSGIRNIAAASAAAKNQTLTVSVAPEIPYSIVCDDLRLSQVITNLLSNAIKFTPEDGNVRLIVECLDQDEAFCRLRFVVEDTGIGIAPDKLANLFNAFEQVDRGISRKYGGTGLGLTISRRIVELMGGEILVDSEPGKGSRFAFELAFAKGGIQPSSDADGLGEVCCDHYDFSGKTLLLVEDIDINREIVIAMLEETRIAIDTAENGQIAFEKVRDGAHRYDIIFMDVQMPVLDGVSATRLIRGLDSEKARTVPIIAMTANAFAEDVEMCRAAGMNEHVSKPIDFNEVLQTMARFLALDRR